MITRVAKIKDCPSFVDFRPSADLPEFKKYNLIYGWNGSGKTSFSRVLRSFELGENYYTQSQRVPEFEFKLKNGGSIDQNKLTVFPNIRVFNKDFIEDSVFRTGGPKPIFFLGKESKEDKETIIKIEVELQILTKDRDSKNALLEKSKTSKTKLLSEKARDIKNSLTTARSDKYRNYERPNLEVTIREKSEVLKTPDNYKLDKDRLAVLQKAIQQTTKADINPLPVLNLDISAILTEAIKLLQKTATSQIIEVLKSDYALGKWVEHGLIIHNERELAICAFCNQTIPQNRLLELENHFNQDYQNLIEGVKRLKEKCSTRKITINFPDTSNFYEDMTSEYLNKKKETDNLVEAFNKRLDSIISVLEQKEQKPFSHIILEDFAPIDEKPLREISQIIERHNKKSENFEKQLDENKDALEMHYIAEFIDTYNELLGEITKLESEHSSLVKIITEKEQESRGIKEKLINHHISAQQINKALEQFLGRSDIQLTATDGKEGYQITRNGVLAKDLSEGEKTALAIVYFLTKINEEGFDLKNGVIVIDDPVSSLDASAIFQAFGFIKESINGAGQIFILTHHFDFWVFVF